MIPPDAGVEPTRAVFPTLELNQNEVIKQRNAYPKKIAPILLYSARFFRSAMAIRNPRSSN